MRGRAIRVGYDRLVRLGEIVVVQGTCLSFGVILHRITSRNQVAVYIVERVLCFANLSREVETQLCSYMSVQTETTL